uniref:V-SNARE coiled-coil homology domain-containing protein n=1 Tax=Paramormyrops kingsleyae TaxID=1676925 RepID=A0A3B3TBY8_9TELE
MELNGQVLDDVEEVRVIMIDNLNKEEERAGKLLDLEDRAHDLSLKSKVFSRTSKKVKKQTQWQLRKMKVLFAVIGVAVVLILIIVVAIALHSNSLHNSNSKPEKAQQNSTSRHPV